MLAQGLWHLSRAQYSSQLLRCMASASADQLSAIKLLREQTGAPMADVRAALKQAEWKPGEVHTSPSGVNTLQSVLLLISLMLLHRWRTPGATEEGSCGGVQEGATAAHAPIMH